MEVLTLVPSCSEDANKSPQVDLGRLSQGHRSRERDADASISHMAHLRDRYRGHNLSQEATTLMLKSWRSKTNKSYDSLFGRWLSWCDTGGSNPFSGPIINVVNFLAQLHSEGYKYNSINAFRSAISLVHERVDGYSGGQHPMVTRLLKGIFNDRPPL